MSETEPTFGVGYRKASSVADRLALDEYEARRADFAPIDAVLDELIAAALTGKRIAEVAAVEQTGGRIELQIPLKPGTSDALRTHFDVEEQEKRGSWYMPEGEALSLGLMHTAYWAEHNSRFLVNLATFEKPRPNFAGQPEAVALWVLEPLFEELFLPFKVRGWNWLGAKTIEQQEKYWAKIDPLYDALEMSGPALDAFRPGTGWSKYGTDDILRLRSDLLATWAAAADDVGPRYRAFRIGQLVERYYSKAKKGPPLRKQVLTAAFSRTLTAYFGGDWLAFLAFLDEEPNPNEEIVQALPETKLMVGTSTRAAEVAAEHGVPAEEVQRMVATYWEQGDGTSPVEQRVNVLQRYWTEFDALHAKQRLGMRSLWGLVQEHWFLHPLIPEDADRPGDFDSGLYGALLSKKLKQEIEQLWGGSVLERRPDAIVTDPAPHARLAEALGPALRLWQGVGLTAWFLCVGPYSRTSIEGMPGYYERDLSALAELGCAVDPSLFSDLNAAEKNDGHPAYGGGLTMKVTISLGPSDTEEPAERHVSFESLRDIITRHRRAWAEQHLDQYLRAAWEAELRTVGEAYQRQLADRGKSLTARQFAKLAAPAANHWFGGDLNGVYRVLGLKSPEASSRRERLVPADSRRFATELYEELRGKPIAEPPAWKEDPEEREKWNEFSALAGMCVDCLQLEEAFERPPELKEFGRQKFKSRSKVLSEDVEEAWRIYVEAVHTVLARTPRAPVGSAS